jgi:hypothetical protein
VPHPLYSKSTEARRFRRLQRRLAPLFARIMPDPSEPRSVVVVPSLSVDSEVLRAISGAQHYEERMLCMLMLLPVASRRLSYT